MTRAIQDREPTDVGEALRQDVWKTAMEQEIEVIEQNGTWELVPRPAKRKIIGVKWVFKTKYHSDGTLDKHKARLVAKGYAQRHRIDYDDTFAPTVRMVTIRTTLAVASKKRWPVY